MWSIWELSVLSLQSLYKFKTVLKLKFIKWKTKLTLFLIFIYSISILYFYLLYRPKNFLVAYSFFQRTSFNIFCRVCMSLGNKFPHFCLKKFLFFFHILKDIFAGYRILGWEEVLLCFFVFFWLFSLHYSLGNSMDRFL